MKYLFCPLASYGFVYPHIGVAKALKKMGHEVAFATGNNFATALEDEGLLRIPFGTRDKSSFELPKWAMPLMVGRQVKHIEFALKEFKPDVLVGTQLGYGALIAAEMHGIPLGIMGLIDYLWATNHIADKPEEERSKREERLVWRIDEMTDLYNKCREIFRLEPVSAKYDESPMIGDLFCVQNVPEYVDNFDHLPSAVHCVGACNWESDKAHEGEELTSWLQEARAAGDPILYVQAGAYFDDVNFVPFLQEAVRDMPVRVLVSVGRMYGTGDYDPKTAPANMFVRDHVPQGVVLPHAHGVISNGNTTVLLGALTNALPLLLIPSGGEHKDAAEMAIRAGVCIGINRPNISADEFKSKIVELLNKKQIRENAKIAQSRFAQVDGFTRVASLLEGLAEKKKSTGGEISPMERAA